ncbi:hypothetical protein D3876_07290 [Sphingomonas cavernae]|uniref:DUF2306 domain-containing protein n=2 Tax=Sphingomonas cavernae TaxID=2320861 RepID=A0A418WSB6_9SPHN|nr:hypothetical protein D3876_07290 [Sphingomonas cavernae]
MAIAMAVTAFIGFAPTYYLAGLNDAPTPLLTPRLHLHGALCTAWMLLLVAQTGLIAAGRADIHRLTGMAGVALGAAIFVSGIFTAIHSERRVHTDLNAGTLADPYVFLIFPFAAVGMFALFGAIGVANRHRPGVHKRLMLLATMSLLGPALARIVTQLHLPVTNAIGALVLINLFLAALVAYDLATRGRLHPATLWGGGFLLISEPLRVAIGYSEPWRAIARAVMG